MAADPQSTDLTPDEALMVAEGPGTLRELVADYHDRAGQIIRLRGILLWVDSAVAIGRPASVIRAEIAKVLHEQ